MKAKDSLPYIVTKDDAEGLQLTHVDDLSPDDMNRYKEIARKNEQALIDSTRERSDRIMADICRRMLKEDKKKP